MSRLVVAAILIATITSSCGRVAESRWNPFNWFGGEQETRVATLDTTAEVRNDVLIGEVLSLSVAPTPGGAIISTLGLAPTQGFWEAELVPLAVENPSTLAFEFRVREPATAAPIGAQAAREVLAGSFLSTQALGSARTITIVAAQNRRSVSRR